MTFISIDVIANQNWYHNDKSTMFSMCSHLKPILLNFCVQLVWDKFSHLSVQLWPYWKLTILLNLGKNKKKWIAGWPILYTDDIPEPPAKRQLHSTKSIAQQPSSSSLDKYLDTDIHPPVRPSMLHPRRKRYKNLFGANGTMGPVDHSPSTSASIEYPFDPTHPQ